jgi:diphthamide synthase (EF-2-diphthine--ammonia ligase)
LHQDPNVEVVGLFTVLNAQSERVGMHTTRLELLQQQAAAAELPLHIAYLPEHPCSNEKYDAVMGKAVADFVAQGVQCIAFGDLFLEDIRAYRDAKMAGTGIELLFPLRKIPTAELAQQMLASGLETYISSVDLATLPANVAGQRWTAELLAIFPADVAPCGENGEIHTIVVNGPMFTRGIDVTVGAISEEGGYAYADILPEV